MTKNFKRVISTVAALAMAASSFVAMAATYPDVAADNKYYSAIEQVSALGIIEGFDDGTFKPDEKVTRAQMAKLVVGAKNLLAEAEGNTRQVFDDVAPGKSEWAMGYVATANDYKIVNGTSDTTFDPDATVTYMQAMKMLVVAAGYEDWAQDQGGWPEGYRYYGNQLKIGAGVSGVSDDTELTRGQVAQMLVNALKAPILDITGYERDNGEKYPIYAQLDGKQNREYQTLLTDAWDVYEVYGRVKATSRGGAGSLKPGEVYYQVEKADNYDDAVVKSYMDTATIDDEEVEVLKGAVAIPTADAAESGAEDLLLEYSYALIHLNDDDEATIVYIESAGKNKTVEFDGELLEVKYNDDDELVSPTTAQLNVYKNENTNSTTKYKLAAGAEMIVNGVSLEGATTDQILEYATEGNVTLVDSPQAGSASIDGEYDYIVVDYYATGVVLEAAEKATGEIKISFDDHSENEGYLTLDPEDEDLAYSFVDTKGAEVDPLTLPEYAVVSIAYNVVEGWDASSFYNVIVSTDKVEGRVSSTYADTQQTNWFVINGTDYKWVADLEVENALEAGDSYTLYLDKDGKIAKYETLASAVNYAIVDRFFETAGDQKVRLVLKDGTKVDYIIDAGEADDEYLAEADFAVGNLETLGDEDLMGRFVEYTVNKNNEVKLEAVEDIDIADGKYVERSNRVDGYALADSSVVLDASAYAMDRNKAVGVGSLSTFVDEMDYKVVVLGKRDQSTGTYPMAVIIVGDNAYSIHTRMAVVASAVSTVEVDNVTKDQVEIVTAADEVEYLIADQHALASLQEGDAIIYYNDAEGEVENFKIVYSVADKTAADVYAEIGDKTPAVTFNGAGTGDEVVKFELWPVIKRASGGLELAVDITEAEADDPETEDVDETVFADITPDVGEDYTFAIDAIGYQYDGTLKRNFVEKLSSVNMVTQSSIAKAAKNPTFTVGSGDDAVEYFYNNSINLAHADNELAFALVRTYDGDVQEVYSIFFN